MSSALPEGRVIGDFRIVREIGRGGMGVVYEAVQLSLQRSVALKVLPSHLTLRPDVIARFHREATIAARLRHGGIVPVHAIAESEGTHFFAMELVDGSPLDKVIARLREDRVASRDGGTRGLAGEALRWAVSIVLQVADALEHAHAAGVIHRDVKPSNILVRPDETAVLTDFGLAREEGLPSLSATGDFAGTPFYVSPEQAMAHRVPVDHRTDVYSLGVTLYELITLRRPFEGKTSREVLSQIILKEPSRPRRWNPALPLDLETICRTAMEKDPDRRYATAGAFAADLRTFLEGRPIHARPLPPWVRAARVVKRNPAATTAVALAVVVAASIGFLAYTMNVARAEQKKRNALEAELSQLRDQLRDVTAGLAAKGLEVERAGSLAPGPSTPGPADTVRSSVIVHSPREVAIMEARNDVQEAREALGRHSVEDARAAVAKAFGRLRDLDTEACVLADADAFDDCGRIAIELRDFHAARVCLEMAMRIRKRLQPDDHFRLPWTQTSLASALEGLGNLSASKGLREEVLAAVSRADPPNPFAVASAKAALARTLFAMKDYAGARKAQEEALAAFETLLAPNHPCIQAAMLELSLTLQALGDLKAARALQEKALAELERVLPPDHPNVQIVRSNLAATLVDIGDFASARALQEKVVEVRERTLPPTHPSVLQARRQLVEILIALGDLPAARVLHEAALKLQENALPPDHPVLKRARNVSQGVDTRRAR